MELSVAKARLAEFTQQLSFSGEIELLRQEKVLPRTSTISRLDTFIRNDSLLRIKERLQRSELFARPRFIVIDKANGYILSCSLVLLLELNTYN